jgi:hypothetical protein
MRERPRVIGACRGVGEAMPLRSMLAPSMRERPRVMCACRGVGEAMLPRSKLAPSMREQMDAFADKNEVDLGWLQSSAIINPRPFEACLVIGREAAHVLFVDYNVDIPTGLSTPHRHALSSYENEVTWGGFPPTGRVNLGVSRPASYSAAKRLM